VVTSGDYQRAYRVGDQIYHHIIDPETLYPSTYWRSVTIVCDDSGLADALSTALFLLPLEEGRELAEKCEAQVMWVDGSGQIYYTAGFESMIRT
jgi:thiamine biosynthesis lipoprotein